MGLFDKLRSELVDIVEWIDDGGHTLVWRFPRYRNQIKTGARLIVRPGQVAVFVHEGKLADVFAPGTYELDTSNLPILSTLLGWKHGFDSPFKSEVYFVRTTQLTDLKWGTPNPIMLRDADFGPIRLRAFGTYTLQALDPKTLLKELVGTDGNFESEEVTSLLRAIIAESFADLLGESKLSALDLASNYRELGANLQKIVQARIDDEYGLAVPQLMLVNVSLPEEVEKALDARSSMGVLGDMGRFQQYQMAMAMPIAAANPGGGGAGMGMGLGMGLGMATQMMDRMNQGGTPQTMQAAPTHVAPPPLAPAPPLTPIWYVNLGGAARGPYSVDQVAHGITAGSVTAQTMVWCAGMPGWLPAIQVPALTGLLGTAVPPPVGPITPPPLGG